MKGKNLEKVYGTGRRTKWGTDFERGCREGVIELGGEDLRQRGVSKDVGKKIALGGKSSSSKSFVGVGEKGLYVRASVSTEGGGT